MISCRRGGRWRNRGGGAVDSRSTTTGAIIHGFPRTAGQSAAHVIRQRILNGELKPGTRLNQADLAERLGMSRIPVRDALHSLAAEGLVSLKAHSSAWVAPLSPEELEDLYEIRIALEPGLCRVAVPRLTADDIAQLEAALDALESVRSEDEWLGGNDRFHSLIYRKSGRPRSVEIVDRARESTRRYTTLFHLLSPGEIDMEHRLILEAIRHSQARRLESLVAAHLSSGYEAMMAAVKDSELTRLAAAGD